MHHELGSCSPKQMLGVSVEFGQNIFWEVMSDRIENVLFISLSPVYPRASPCYLCHLLEQKDLGFHNLWFNLCPLTVSPYPTFQDQRFGFCSFSEMRVHLYWRIKCFGSWNTHVFFLSLMLLLFSHIVFPRSQNTNGIKNNHLNASHGLPHPISGISMHSVGSTFILPIFLGSLVETDKRENWHKAHKKSNGRL